MAVEGRSFKTDERTTRGRESVMLMLDTHILIWLDGGSDFLGSRARRVIETAHKSEEIGLATVSFWEIGMLVEQRKLNFEGVLSEWRVNLLNSGFIEIPADGAVSLMAAGLKKFSGDLADRIIVATALAEKASLVTADESLLGYRRLKTINGRR